MNTRNAIAIVVLTAAIGLSTAGCGSDSTSATPPSSTKSAAATPAAGALPASDCAIIRPIAGSALSKLAPLQSMPAAEAATAMTQYLTELQTAAAGLSSAQAKTDLGALNSALQQASSPDAGTAIVAAVTKLGADCP
ncbi:hypothetical protein OG874_10935 [Nocardia sp. NBC_00565]|uniref:hypothetical protein n=1 Tax=Nocardia sp. NBC_00565 TaxID=2975993 RepID=UPI002E8235B7|nr:hypothetical protein [Nocardia sp. NBC_00565]WUC05618.1 hypothetical protein OG874_10935 [Nocardia sp. NBC_00565]